MTNNITQEDIKSRKSYEEYRKKNIKRIRKEIEHRRIQLGVDLIFNFQNFEIILFQLQELLRAERISESTEIAKYIHIYNQLIPGQNQLSGLLFLEFQSKESIPALLHNFQKVPKIGIIHLETDDMLITGKVEDNTNISFQCVYRVTFEFTGNQIQKFIANQNNVAVIFQQKDYRENVNLNAQTVQALSDDFHV